LLPSDHAYADTAQPHLPCLDAAATPTWHAWMPLPSASRTTCGAAEGTAPCLMRRGVSSITMHARNGTQTSCSAGTDKDRHLHRRAAISVGRRTHRFQKSDAMKLGSMWTGQHLMSLPWFPLLVLLSAWIQRFFYETTMLQLHTKTQSTDRQKGACSIMFSFLYKIQ
jgi:hypothetical protein